MKKTSLALGLCLLSSLGTLYADDQSDYVVTVKTNSEVVDTAGSFSVVTAKEIEKINADSMQKVLENTVGINTGINDRSINGRKNISFRGMNSKHTAILIDGNRVANTDAQIGHSDFKYNWVPVDQIAKVEVIRGPMSSLYVSKALGGVINIITKKPKNSFSGNVDMKMNFPGSQSSSIFVAKRFDDFSFSVSAEEKKRAETRSVSYSALTNKYDMNSDVEGLDLRSANVKLGYDLTDSSDISLSIVKTKEYREATVAGVHYDKYYDIDNSLYSGSYNQQTSFGGFNLKLNYTENASHSDQVTKTHTLKDKALSSEWYIDALDANYIVFGAEWKNDFYSQIYDSPKYKPHPAAPVELDASNFKDDISNISFYAQDELGLGDMFLLTLGGRYDHHEKFKGQFSPKAYLVVKLASHHRLKAGYGRGFNAPTITQNSDKYTALNLMGTTMDTKNLREFHGNSKLEPEITDTYELGYEYFDALHSFKLTAFYNDIDDLIEPRDLDKNGTTGYRITKYVNVARAITAGAEVEFTRASLLPRLDLGVFYTYLYTKDKDRKRVLSFKPEHKVNVNLDYAINNKINTSLRYAYTGRQKNFRDLEEKIDILKGYNTVSWQIGAKLKKNFRVRFGVDNIFGTTLSDAYNYNLPKASCYVGLNYKFD